MLDKPKPSTGSTFAQLAEFAASFRDDPYGFVMAMYPWGEALLADGSVNPLRYKTGPEDWQKDILVKLGNHIKLNDQLIAMGFSPWIWRSAIASGHGVGKSALVAWLNHFFMGTRAQTRGVTTANTQKQLEDKTWPELAKWHKLFLLKGWFEWSATAYTFKLAPEEERKNYRISALTVAEDNTEAFAGMHNETGTVVMIFDEASGINSKIWEVAQGALTDGEGFFFAFGNPTQPDGEFADCFDKNKLLYTTGHVDSRTVSFTNKNALDDIINLFGEDSDAARVRVYGRFPRQAYNGFISPETILEAQQRELYHDPGAPIIMSVDVARFGPDKSVIRVRQGRDARSYKPKRFQGIPTTKLAEHIATEYRQIRPDALVVESTGPGGPVIDMLRNTYHIKVVEVHPGAPSGLPEHYYRKRDELWAKGRDWLVENGCIDPDDKDLAEELRSIQYTLDRFEQKTKMEAKEELKLRIGRSPDDADTLMLSFAVNPLRRDANLDLRSQRNQAVTEYDVMAYGT
jgi:hypothetical protein